MTLSDLCAKLLILKGKITLVLVSVVFIIGISVYLYTGNADNLVTVIASDIIQNQTGIDIEKMLPHDSDHTTP